ncbi:hypothetical protein [Streptomyces narbonensis]|uniref:hypothetical protein n=1 Tax=Streptomyces narbonensis TaxID=67333 RepID=UPI0033C37BC6
MKPHDRRPAAGPTPATDTEFFARRERERRPGGTFVRDITAALADIIRGMGVVLGTPTRLREMRDVLRGAEAVSSGIQRDRLGCAAGNLDCAMWVGADTETGRPLLATALDYLQRATGNIEQS